MSSRRNFIAMALAGEVMTEEIDDYVDDWHNNPGDLAFHEFLGMDRAEYALWLKSPDTLPLIIASRKLGKPLDVIANDNLQEMRLAARADDTSKIKRLQTWLLSRQQA